MIKILGLGISEIGVNLQEKMLPGHRELPNLHQLLRVEGEHRLGGAAFPIGMVERQLPDLIAEVKETLEASRCDETKEA